MGACGSKSPAAAAPAPAVRPAAPAVARPAPSTPEAHLWPSPPGGKPRRSGAPRTAKKKGPAPPGPPVGYASPPSTHSDPAADAKDARINSLLAAMTYETQAKTQESVGNMERQLENTLEIADATQGALDAQSEQLDGVRADVTAVSSSVGAADAHINEFESWRVFGGRSKNAGRKAAESFEPKRRSSAVARRKAAEKYGVKTAAVDGPRRPRPRAVVAAPAAGDVRWATADVGSSTHRVAADCVGRTREEADALKTIRDADDGINAGITRVDGLIDRLASRAEHMHATAAAQNRGLDDVADKVDDVNRSVSRVNARAQHNVRRMR